MVLTKIQYISKMDSIAKTKKAISNDPKVHLVGNLRIETSEAYGQLDRKG